MTNIFFKPYPRRFTWIFSNEENKNQIDYCLSSLRCISSIDNLKTRLEADCGSDLQQLVAKLRVYLKTNERQQQKLSQRIEGKNEWKFSEPFYSKRLERKIKSIVGLA